MHLSYQFQKGRNRKHQVSHPVEFRKEAVLALCIYGISRAALFGHSHLFGRGVRCAAGGGDVTLQIVGGVGRQTDGACGGQCAARAGALAGGRTRLAPTEADVLN